MSDAGPSLPADFCEKQFLDGPHYNRSLNRLALSCERPADVAKAALLYREHGVVVMRQILSAETIRRARDTVRRFEDGLRARYRLHDEQVETVLPLSWYRTLITRSDLPRPIGFLTHILRRTEEKVRESLGEPNRYAVEQYFKKSVAYLWDVPFIAPVLADLLTGPARHLMHSLAGSDRLCIQLSHTLIRAVDDCGEFSVWGHQDAKAVNPHVRYNIWIPLEPIVHNEASGLGFLASRIDEVLEPGDGVRDFCLRRYSELWFPDFRPGDAAFFDNTTIHQTSNFDTGRRRWSFEMRYMRAEDAAPSKVPDHMKAWPVILIVNGEVPRFSLANIPYRRTAWELARALRVRGGHVRVS